jgi:hypothetical protein
MKVGDLVRFRGASKNALFQVMRMYRGGKGGNAPRVDVMYLFSGYRVSTEVRPSMLEVVGASR